MPEQHYDSISRAGRQLAVVAIAVTALGSTFDDAFAQRRISPESLLHIQDVSPLHGPIGTEVTIFTENLPLQAKVHLGIGATRAGFEALLEVQQGIWGEVGGTVTIPETAPWDRVVIFVAFDAIFAPIAISDPFHVTNADGLLQRTGEITDQGVECLAMRDTDGYLYTLIGEIGDLEAGDAVVLEGGYVETSICMQGTTISVTRTLPNNR